VQGMGGAAAEFFGAMAMGDHHVAANTGKKRRRAAPRIRSERDALEIQRAHAEAVRYKTEWKFS